MWGGVVVYYSLLQSTQNKKTVIIFIIEFVLEDRIRVTYMSIY